MNAYTWSAICTWIVNIGLLCMYAIYQKSLQYVCIQTNCTFIWNASGVQKCPSRIVHSKKGGKAVQTDFERKIPNNETPEARDLPL